MLKKLTYKNKYIWRTSDDEWQQNCLFDFALFQKKKKSQIKPLTGLSQQASFTVNLTTKIETCRY